MGVLINNLLLLLELYTVGSRLSYIYTCNIQDGQELFIYIYDKWKINDKFKKLQNYEKKNNFREKYTIEC